MKLEYYLQQTQRGQRVFLQAAVDPEITNADYERLREAIREHQPGEPKHEHDTTQVRPPIATHG